MKRCTQTYSKWSKEVADQENAYFVDLNDLTARKFDVIGKEDTQAYYKDLVHASKTGLY